MNLHNVIPAQAEIHKQVDDIALDPGSARRGVPAGMTN